MSGVVDVIKHYQRSIGKYSADQDRILHCIGKLRNLPISVTHLQETGVGKTVNALRKYEGDVGHSARSLIAKWKEMVAADESSNSETEETIQNEPENNGGRQSVEKEDPPIQINDTPVTHTKKKHKKHDRDHESSKHKEHRTKDKENKAREHSSTERNHKRKTEEHSKGSKRKHIENACEDEESDAESEHSKVYEASGSSLSNHTDNKESWKDSGTHSKKSDKHKEEKSTKHHHKHKSDKRSHSSSKKEHKKKTYESDEHEEISKPSSKQTHSEKPHKSKKHNSSKHTNSSQDVSCDLSDHFENFNESSEKGCDKTSSNDEYAYEIPEKQKKSSSNDKHKEKDKSKYRENGGNSVIEDTSKHKSSRKTETKSSKDYPTTSVKTVSEKRMKVQIVDPGNSDDEGINSYSGASFAEALGMSSPAKKKIKVSKPSTPPKTSNKQPTSFVPPTKENALDLLCPNTKLPQLDLDITLPTISPNYQPGTSSDSLWGSPANRNKGRSQEETLSINISSKNQRTKVYSGNKTAWGVVPSLFDLCIRILQDNIDALAYTGGVPYSILLPVLERATPDQLFMLEHHNAYFLEDTEPLWEQHCKREFRGKSRIEMETWREAYSRFLTEREEKLRALTANIKQSIDKSLPIRQTKLAYVDSVAKPPRGVARRQAKWGTASTAKPVATPASRVAALAGTVCGTAVPNPGQRAVSHSSGSVSKPKKAPLMQKTLALIKSTNRYRR